MEARNKRKAAEAFSEKAEALLKANKKMKAYVSFLQAEVSQSTISSELKTHDDWRKLAAYREKLAENATNKQKFKWYAQAFRALSEIPRAERTSSDWRALAHLCRSAGVASEHDYKLSWFKKAINKFKKILDGECEDLDYYHLALALFEFAYLVTPEAKMDFLIQGIATLNKTSMNGRNVAFWHVLGEYQFKIGVLYLAKNDYLNAQFNFNAVLNSEEVELSRIGLTYVQLDLMSVFYLMSKRINELGVQTFSTSTLPRSHFERTFSAIYIELRTHKSGADLMQFIRLMRLLDKFVTHKDFPNTAVVAWLSDPEKAQNFKNMLQELQEIYRPLMLADSMEAGLGTTLAIVLKLKALEKEIADLKALMQQQLPQVGGAGFFAASETKDKEKETIPKVERLVRPSGP